MGPPPKSDKNKYATDLKKQKVLRQQERLANFRAKYTPLAEAEIKRLKAKLAKAEDDAAYWEASSLENQRVLKRTIPMLCAANDELRREMERKVGITSATS